MKSKLDILLIIGMALCYGLGHLFSPTRFVIAAGLLLVVFLVRLAGSTITWTITGR